MNTHLIAALTLGLSATVANAGGFDRSGQPIGIIFEEGNVLQFTASFTDPSLDGVDILGNATGNVAQSFQTYGIALKYQFSDKLSFAIVQDEPFGADILYSSASPLLAGTGAVVDSVAITALARYKFNNRISVHGGLRYQQVSSTVPLGGGAFAASGLNGFNASFGNDGALGYVIGAAYEIPDIALRVSLTYNSQIDHDLPTTETINGVLIGAPSTTSVTTPESLNLAFQSGIAKDTLLFGSIRYGKHADTVVSPAVFGAGGLSLTDLEDSADFEIGVGRRFNDKWSGTLALGHQQGGADNLVSPLAPTDGATYISVGAKYDVNEKVSISGGIRYTDLGDAIAAPGGTTAIANFNGNSAVTAGFRISYKF